MPAQDTSQTKEKILRFLRIRGPSLPVHIAGEIGQSILFTSAFLSELLSEKKIKISNLRVGSSPVYFIPGQERGLEKYSQHLKSKEKEAFLLLKQKKFLKDIDQLPAIRVALRAINDFAIPFKPINSDDIFWRFFTVPESEFKQFPQSVPKKLPSLSLSPQQASGREALQKKPEDSLNIFDTKSEREPAAKKKTVKKSVKKTVKKTPSKKQDNKFFNKVKEFLAKIILTTSSASKGVDFVFSVPQAFVILTSLPKTLV